jgi:hypothetical protein
VPEPVPAEVLGAESLEVWALRLSGGPVRDLLTTDPGNVVTREYVFAVPLDVMGNLARKLTEVYERQRGAAPEGGLTERRAKTTGAEVRRCATPASGVAAQRNVPSRES